MEIISKLVEINAVSGIDNHFIDKNLEKMGITNPLRWAIVNVKGSKLTVSVAHESLC
jgi:hypothetical protein